MAQVRNYKEAGFASLFEELKWRGLISQSTDEQQLAQALDGEPLTYYCGYDPTAASLHIGNLVQLINMRHLQAAGHHPIALVGGATGLIGDPRQSGERTLNSKDIVAGWAERLRKQIGRILPLDGENPVRFVSNYDWVSKMSAIDFLRDVGKNFRVGTMLSKDIVARRLNSDEGISFAEFSYQVLQGNDFLYLFDNYNVTLQLGGSDQWGNLTSGMDLIRKVRGASVHVFTSPIITDNQGRKFGKSEGNAMWLDPTMLSLIASISSGLISQTMKLSSFLKLLRSCLRARLSAWKSKFKKTQEVVKLSVFSLGKLQALFMVKMLRIRLLLLLRHCLVRVI